MSNFMRTCVCCGGAYYGRGTKDSLCDDCNGSYWRQSANGFDFKKTDSIMYEWEPTDAYRKSKGLKIKDKK